MLKVVSLTRFRQSSNPNATLQHKQGRCLVKRRSSDIGLADGLAKDRCG